MILTTLVRLVHLTMRPSQTLSTGTYGSNYGTSDGGTDPGKNARTHLVAGGLVDGGAAGVAGLLAGAGGVHGHPVRLQRLERDHGLTTASIDRSKHKSESEDTRIA